LVQIRDLNTHLPLNGITVGDIGPKYGFNAKDNGFLKLDQVRIPRENMLMKYAKVNRKGQFTKPDNEKVGYATMMQIRTQILIASAMFLAQALTIGVRYSLVRLQLKDESGQKLKIFDYQLQMEKLIPLIADAYAMLFGYYRLYDMIIENMKRINSSQDFSMMNDIHAILSGCKAVYSNTMFWGIEKIQLACGGYGFSHYSGLPNMLVEGAPKTTYEGENTVMLLQSARYLIKSLNNGAKG